MLELRGGIVDGGLGWEKIVVETGCEGLVC